MKTIDCDVAVVGAGPAGLAAAEAAKSTGAGKVIIIERDIRAGGILQQGIHPGFGLQIFGEELTGPEYAERYMKQADSAGVELLLGTTALELRDRELVCAGTEGLLHVRFGALVLAMGCRERTRANLVIPGSRPSGIYTAGTAQKLINIYGDKIGKEVVILGSGDIGMIMARRLTLEGAHVKAVVELLPFLAGLTRNKVQCLDDFGIPLLLSHTVVDIEGVDRLTSVTVCPVDEKRRPVLDKQEKIPCDTLLLSVGLIPENELSRTGKIELSPVTRGAVVNQYKQTSNPAVFACGNVLHVNDLVDHVSRESAEAGRNAALYAAGKLPSAAAYAAVPGNGIRYVCPQKVVADGNEEVTLYFRTMIPGRRTVIRCTANGKELVSRKCVRTSPGTMEKLVLSKETVASLNGPIEVSCEHGEVLA
ncbi:MAG: FAD-dependent oxidoreductase [Kiritimatiellae bacterium]|nr:FAD-dependent oxidoreductase [Kiritimatiellia bacterium]